VKTRTQPDADRAPILAPRIVTVAVTPGEEVVVEASTDLADWEITAALRRAIEIWEEPASEEEE